MGSHLVTCRGEGKHIASAKPNSRFMPSPKLLKGIGSAASEIFTMGIGSQSFVANRLLTKFTRSTFGAIILRAVHFSFKLGQ